MVKEHSLTLMEGSMLGKWEGCKEGVSYWDEGGNEFDKNLNLISTN